MGSSSSKPDGTAEPAAHGLVEVSRNQGSSSTCRLAALKPEPLVSTVLVPYPGLERELGDIRADLPRLPSGRGKRKTPSFSIHRLTTAISSPLLPITPPLSPATSSSTIFEPESPAWKPDSQSSVQTHVSARITPPRTPVEAASERKTVQRKNCSHSLKPTVSSPILPASNPHNSRVRRKPLPVAPIKPCTRSPRQDRRSSLGRSESLDLFADMFSGLTMEHPSPPSILPSQLSKPLTTRRRTSFLPTGEHANMDSQHMPQRLIRDTFEPEGEKTRHIRRKPIRSAEKEYVKIEGRNASSGDTHRRNPHRRNMRSRSPKVAVSNPQGFTRQNRSGAHTRERDPMFYPNLDPCALLAETPHRHHSKASQEGTRDDPIVLDLDDDTLISTRTRDDPVAFKLEGNDPDKENGQNLTWQLQEAFRYSFMELADREQQERGDEAMARRLYEEDLVRTRDCGVCGHSVPIPDLPALTNCNHEPQVCITCFASWIESEMDSKGWKNISCPGTSCRTLLSYGDVRQYATAKDFERFDTLAARAACNDDPDFRWCRAEGCQSGQVHSSGEEGNIFTCIECGHRVCIVHDNIWHEGETCEEYNYRASGQQGRDRREQEEASIQAIEQLSKKCPGANCAYNIEKNDGCDHMTCQSCHYEFCWECLADYNRIRARGNTAHRRSCRYHSSRIV